MQAWTWGDTIDPEGLGNKDMAQMKKRLVIFEVSFWISGFRMLFFHVFL